MDPLTFSPLLCDLGRDFNLIDLWLTRCVTVTSSVARTTHAESSANGSTPNAHHSKIRDKRHLAKIGVQHDGVGVRLALSVCLDFVEKIQGKNKYIYILTIGRISKNRKQNTKNTVKNTFHPPLHLVLILKLIGPLRVFIQYNT